MAREGIPFVTAAAVLLVVIGLAAAIVGSDFIWVLASIQAILLLFVTYFFRDPDRTPPSGDRLVTSVADGHVVAITRTSNPEPGGNPLVLVSVFLSIFDVHVNRVPVGGVVKSVGYNPGKFLAAWKEKASEDNEQTLISIDCEGHTVYFKQIAGFVARRISCNLQTAQRVYAGERFGMIRFGSRADILLPEGSEIKVKKRQKVKAGETIIGILPYAD